MSILWVAGRSPIRLSPIEHSPMAKVRRYIGESIIAETLSGEIAKSRFYLIDVLLLRLFILIF
jgi:hypothetical protein